MDSLYEILKQIGHSFKLKLLKSIKVHPVFYTKKLLWWGHVRMHVP